LAVFAVLDAVPGQHLRYGGAPAVTLVDLVHRQPRLHVLFGFAVEDPLAAVTAGVERLAAELAAAQADPRRIADLAERHRDLAHLTQLGPALEEDTDTRFLESLTLVSDAVVVAVERVRVLLGQPLHVRVVRSVGRQRGGKREVVQNAIDLV